MPAPCRLDLEPLKLYIESHFPVPVLIALYAVYRRLAEHKRRQAELWQRLGSPDTVASGTFAGMLYINEARGSALLPKLLGTYEFELAGVIREIVAAGPDLLIDIGSAEGYYAVGLARAVPSLRVIALDPDRYARHLLCKLARRNGVEERITPRGACSARELEELLMGSKRPLVVCDCEGAEDDLLDPALAPALKRAAMLVELHETIRPGVSARIRHRFRGTHTVHTIQTRPRTPSDFPLNVAIDADAKRAAMYELRGGLTMEWDYLVPPGWSESATPSHQPT